MLQLHDHPSSGQDRGRGGRRGGGCSRGAIDRDHTNFFEVHNATSPVSAPLFIVVSSVSTTPSTDAGGSVYGGTAYLTSHSGQTEHFF